MANFFIYDLILLGIFVAFLSIFLYKRRKNLNKEGLLLLYKTSWGIKLINKVGNKYQKTLQVLSYISVTLGYLLMAGILYFVGRIVWIYLTLPDVVRAIKVPPIMPLVPYLPQAFGLDFLPPLYFIYWIVIIAVIAITHEFAHGIFAAKNKVDIKTTGFGFFPFFLPVFLAAFVELNEKVMAKKKIFKQLAILSAGTFANILTAIVFFLVLVGFFLLAFAPSGVIYDSYPIAPIAIGAVTMVNNMNVVSPTYENVVGLLDEEGLNNIKTDDGEFLATKKMLDDQKNERDIYVVYYDAPAINAELESTILKINGVTVGSISDLSMELTKYSPGDKITINILGEDGTDYNRDLVLGEHPDGNRAWLGISFKEQQSTGILGTMNTVLSSFRQSNVYYAPTLGDVSVFIYDLLWWVVIISLSVALINMLPVGIFDGGRFFYLTILALTKSENKARKLFKFSTYLFLALLVVLLVAWALAIR